MLTSFEGGRIHIGAAKERVAMLRLGGTMEGGALDFPQQPRDPLMLACPLGGTSSLVRGSYIGCYVDDACH